MPVSVCLCVVFDHLVLDHLVLEVSVGILQRCSTCKALKISHKGMDTEREKTNSVKFVKMCPTQIMIQHVTCLLIITLPNLRE